MTKHTAWEKLKRPLGVTVVGLVLIIAAVIGRHEWLSYRFNRQFEQRQAYWRAKVDHDLPVGTSFEVVKAWSSRNRLEPPTIDKVLQDDSVTLETLEVPGWAFPCTNWMFLLHIDWDPQRHIASREVTAGGACL
jgi:hypothetical protein